MAATRIDGEYGLLIVLLFGLSILNGFLADIRKLTGAAKKSARANRCRNSRSAATTNLARWRAPWSKWSTSCAPTDRLTGVAMREWLLRQIAPLQRQGTRKLRVALRFVDLDNFKFSNDHYGHAAGDRAPASVAARMKLAVRRSDIVARYGGDEFVVLLKDMGRCAK
jgi:diguanylate cyclase